MPSLADTATWIAVAFAVLAAALALTASLVLLVLVARRSRAGQDARPSPGAAAAREDLAGALADARE